MNKVLGMGFAVILVVVGFLLFPSLMDSTHEAQTDSYTDTFGGVTTAAATTNATVTLVKTLYGNDIAEVASITSDNTNDHPSVENYTSSSKALIVKALEANTSRNLTVVYNIDDTASYTGTSQFLGMTPLLILLGVLAIIAVGVVVAFRMR